MSYEDVKNNKIRVVIRKTDGRYNIGIPRSILEMLDLHEGDIVKVPFLLFEKGGDRIEKQIENNEIPYEYVPTGPETLEVTHYGEKIQLNRADIINVLNNPTAYRVTKYRSMYMPWHGNKYHVGKIVSELTGRNINSGRASDWLDKMGFKIVHMHNK